MNTFHGQVLRLEELVDKLEHKVKIEPIDEELVMEEKDNLVRGLASVQNFGCPCVRDIQKRRRTTENTDKVVQ